DAGAEQDRDERGVGGAGFAIDADRRAARDEQAADAEGVEEEFAGLGAPVAEMHGFGKAVGGDRRDADDDTDRRGGIAGEQVRQREIGTQVEAVMAVEQRRLVHAAGAVLAPGAVSVAARSKTSKMKWMRSASPSFTPPCGAILLTSHAWPCAR